MEAINQAVDSTIQTNNTLMWIMFTLFVIAPIGLALIMLPVAFLQLRNLKCPKCGNMRHNKVKGMQTISETKDGKATVTTGRLVICRKCKNEFLI